MSQPWDKEFRGKANHRQPRKKILRRLGRKVDLVAHAMCLTAVVYFAIAVHTVKSSRR